MSSAFRMAGPHELPSIIFATSHLSLGFRDPLGEFQGSFGVVVLIPLSHFEPRV